MRAIAMAATVLVAASTALAGAPAAQAAPQISANEMISRANSWRTAYPAHSPGHPVPYSSEQRFNGYRQDCSGYVAMAAKLEADPGPRTVELAQDWLSKKISLAELRRGDLLVDPEGTRAEDRHVVIFDRWVNPERSGYYAYEQRSGVGTDYRVLTYGLYRNDQYVPRRLLNVTP